MISGVAARQQLCAGMLTGRAGLCDESSHRTGIDVKYITSQYQSTL